jgi:hypothetical protein
MLRHCYVLFGFFLTLLSSGFVLANQPASGGKFDLNANAALHYWRAAACLPSLTEKEQDRLGQDAVTVPLDDWAKKVVADSDTALREMHYGAGLRDCAWGVSIQDGVFAQLNEMRGVRLLAGVACLRSRLRFEAGQTASALDDIVDTLIMGRHASQGSSIIALLVNFATEARATVVLAAYLPKLDPATLKALDARLNKLPAPQTLADALLKFELPGGLEWFIRQVKTKKNRAELLSFLQEIDPKESPAKLEEFLKESGDSVDGVLRFAEEAGAAYPAWAGKINLPRDQFEAEYAKFAKSTRAANPVLKLLFPELQKCRQSVGRFEALVAMRKAAIDIQLNGPDVVKQHPDPCGHGPLQYVAVDGGYELRSQLLVLEKPFALRVGQPKERPTR